MEQTSLKCVLIAITVEDDFPWKTFILMHSYQPPPRTQRSHLFSTVFSTGGPLYFFVQSSLCSKQENCDKYKR